MKKFTLFLFLFSSINLYAAWGLFDADRSYIVLNVNGNSTTKTVWNSGAGTPATNFFNGADFGTFNIGQTFQLNAYDIKTWKNSGGDVTGGKFYYIVYPTGNRPSTPIFNELNISWIENIGSSGDQKWGVSSQSINLLNGLSPGAFSLEIYAEMSGNIPTQTVPDNNIGSNYIATFTVLPLAPTITSFTPDNGCPAGGTSVVITGTNFTGATAVTFNGVNAASYTVNSATQITAVTSASVTTGVIAVTTSGGTATSIGSFTVNTAVIPLVSIVASANPVVSGTSVEFTATPVNGGTPLTTTYQWYINGNPAGFNQPTLTYNPLNNNTIYVVMTSSLPCTSPVQSNTITMEVTLAPPNSTWDGSTDNDWHTAANWSDGVPGSTTNVIIPFTGISNFPTIGSTAVCHNITLESGASILGNNHLSVTGAASVERFFAGNEWHLLSSPIINANTAMFAGKYLQYHNETNNKYYDILSADSAITVAKGYAIWGGSGFTRTFVGPLNNNDKTYTVKKAGLGWNLVGNPYPSGIDWDLVVLPTGVANAIYKHVNNSTWATYIDDVSVPGANDESLIAPCQGFFVKATSNAALEFTDAARVHAPITYYKQSNNRVSNLVRLQVSGYGYQDETVVRFLPEATAEFDGSYDALKMNGDVPEAAQIYSWGGIELAINSLPETNMVPVGIHVGASGTYTIAATEINDLNYITLEDTKTSTFTELANKSYTFDFIAGENEQRFKLHFSSVGIDEKETTTANIYSYQQTVYVNLADNAQGDIYIYNLAGQLITAQESASGNVRIGLTSLGVYMVKVVTEKETLTQKVVIR